MRNLELGESSPSEQAIKEELLSFTNADSATRKARLPWIVQGLPKLIGPTMAERLTDPLRNPELQGKITTQDVQTAVQKALATPFRGIYPPVDMHPWEGGYTVAVVGDGKLYAVVSNPVGPIYEKPHNLIPDAVGKANLSFFLKEEGDLMLDSDQAINDLEKLGLNDICLGEAWGNRNGVRIHVGVSGCELNQDYIDGLVPSSERGIYHPDFLTGRTDQIFARLVADALSDKSHRHLREPDVFSELRRSHAKSMNLPRRQMS
ncbi:MAG TPA: hypothetical protein VLF68_03295 [Candidatus Saccharimonadales bacterium]|nr:hypothetical protein [Candidatus Saccharimonadales bacterium]